MRLLDQLTQAADEEQLLLQPLVKHAAAGQEEHLRRHYALLLAALLSAQEKVSESQSRLLILLLGSLELEDIRAALFEEARKLETATLKEAARLIRNANLGENLLVDALILLRLEAPLADDAVQLVGELAAFLGIDNSLLAVRVSDAAQILGLGEITDSPLLEFWPERIPYKLTTEALEAGIEGGLWFVEDNLKIYNGWQAQDAVILFQKGAVLLTENSEKVQITNCKFNLARLEFIGESDITITDSEFTGNYQEGEQGTAEGEGKPVTAYISLQVTGNQLTVTGSHFSTPGASAIRFNGSKNIHVDSCTFEHCGGTGCTAGAISMGDTSHNIKNSTFTSCLGEHAGAIYTSHLKNINGCCFDSCSISKPINGVANLAVSTANADGNPAVNNTTFNNCSLNISYAGRWWGSSGATFIKHCQFNNGSYYYYDIGRNTLEWGCSFNNGQVIEKRI